MVTVENLMNAWQQFKQGKRKRRDIQYFERRVEDLVFQLSEDLVSQRYQHGQYQHFYVFDPQKRYISKACVRDRLVHQMLYETLSRVFDKTFFDHSFSCRAGKGTHKGIEQLHKILRKVSKNGKQACFSLKMDVQRFFDSVDHNILKELLRKRLKDHRMLHLIDQVIDSFHHLNTDGRPVGLPLGNVTSQIFANVYLHELDQFVKHTLRQQFYLRYCDDLIFVAHDKEELQALVTPIRTFLAQRLKLTVHPKKIILSKQDADSGIAAVAGISIYRLTE